MNNSIEGKVVIVTGGASGIGEATVHAFANHGARMVVIADIQDDLGQSLASSIGLDRCTYIHCDVTDESQVESMVQSTVKNYGHLDIMFSNAGTINHSKSIMELDLSVMDRLFEVNVRGMAACVKHAARAMVESGVKGSIIITASLGASRGFDGKVHDYIMSKHATLGLMRSTSVELGKYGIRVNCVSPGAVVTPLVLEHSEIKDQEKVEQDYSYMNSLKGLVLKVNHVADAVLFLASDQSAFITGHNLVVDGGLLAR